MATWSAHAGTKPLGGGNASLLIERSSVSGAEFMIGAPRSSHYADARTTVCSAQHPWSCQEPESGLPRMHFQASAQL